VGTTTDTRERMISSAALMLRERGVAGTSVAKVLEHCSGPRGSVQFHFPGGKNQLVAEALGLAGGLVSGVLADASAQGARPGEVLASICEFYKRQLIETGFQAGCPVGAAAQESFADPVLGPVIAKVMDDWATGLAAVLVADGRTEEEALDLALLSISVIEGAITVSRLRRSTRPLDLVLDRLLLLL
jgi:TetR/AcrR family transcriptional repressor of lmrAB and yxaGH operons